MGWVLVLGLAVCLVSAPLRLVFKADLDASRWQIYLEPGYHDIGLPGGSERALALRREKRKPKKPKPELKEVLPVVMAWLPGILKALKYLLPKLSLGGEAQILFSTGDAAQSAMVYGALNALNQILWARWPGKWRLRFGVSFSEPRLGGRIMGMIEFRPGHIMYAALIAALEYAKGRIHTWTNTPSKAL